MSKVAPCALMKHIFLSSTQDHILSPKLQFYATWKEKLYLKATCLMDSSNQLVATSSHSLHRAGQPSSNLPKLQKRRRLTEWPMLLSPVGSQSTDLLSSTSCLKESMVSLAFIDMHANCGYTGVLQYMLGMCALIIHSQISLSLIHIWRCRRAI